MPQRPAALVATLLLTVACTSSPSSVRECTADADCGDGNVCHQGGCAANAAPVAVLSAPLAATTHRLVTLAASTTDPEGRPVTHRWTVHALEGGCEPEAEPSTGPALEVVFWCPGTYEAFVVPIDDRGVEGSPSVRSFTVEAATGAPVVVAAPAIAATHSCDVASSACRVIAPDGSTTLRLAADGTDPHGAPLNFEWRALPPANVAGDPSLTVAFAPAANLDRTTATVTNGGGALAGVYRFRARATNPAGLIGQALQEVVVANTAPTLLPAPFLVAHTYLDGRFVAEGEIETGASDADGDPLAVSATLTSATPTGCAEEVVPATGTAVRVRITCGVASSLIGETARTLTVVVEDANGGSAHVASPLAIQNRPPEVVLSEASGGSPLTVDHRVEPCVLAAAASCFVADGVDPFIASDPDGDPLGEYQLGATVAPARTSSKGTVSVEGDRYRFRFESPSSIPLEFRSAAGASGFSVVATVKDPWGATGSASATLLIRNRAPVVKMAVPAVAVQHVYDAPSRRYLASATGASFEDPDGDPVTASVPAATPCNAVTLEAGRATIGCGLWWDYTVGGLPPLGAFVGVKQVTVTARDAWETVASATSITILDRPATVSAPVATVENCVCSSMPPRTYSVSYTAIPIPVELTDPDGDPSEVTLDQSFTATMQRRTCVPGWCNFSANADAYSFPQHASGTVTASEGLALPLASAPFDVTPTCSVARTPCG